MNSPTCSRSTTGAVDAMASSPTTRGQGSSWSHSSGAISRDVGHCGRCPRTMAWPRSSACTADRARPVSDEPSSPASSFTHGSEVSVRSGSKPVVRTSVPFGSTNVPAISSARRTGSTQADLKRSAWRRTCRRAANVPALTHDRPLVAHDDRSTVRRQPVSSARCSRSDIVERAASNGPRSTVRSFAARSMRSATGSSRCSRRISPSASWGRCSTSRSTQRRMRPAERPRARCVVMG